MILEGAIIGNIDCQLSANWESGLVQRTEHHHILSNGLLHGHPGPYQWGTQGPP